MNRSPSDEGQTLIEVIVAMVVLALLIFTTLELTATAAQGRLRVSQWDNATALATAVIGQADLTGCGIVTGAEPATTLGDVASGCLHFIPSGDQPTTDLPVGDVDSPDGEIPSGSYFFGYSLRTSWEIAPGLYGSTSTCQAIANDWDDWNTNHPQNPLPMVLTRQVTVGWSPVNGNSASVTPPANDPSAWGGTYTQAELAALPPDSLAYHQAGLSMIVIQDIAQNATADAWTLHAPSTASDGTTYDLTRHPVAVGNTNCVLFPYLPQGVYQITGPDGSHSINVPTSGGAPGSAVVEALNG